MFKETVKKAKLKSGVGMIGTLVPMSTELLAGTHKNFQIFGTAGFRPMAEMSPGVPSTAPPPN